MAQAFIAVQFAVNRQSDNQREFFLSVAFSGSDVPEDPAFAGPFEMYSGPIPVGASAAQLQNDLAAVAVAKAATLGLTVGNGDTLM